MTPPSKIAELAVYRDRAARLGADTAQLAASTAASIAAVEHLSAAVAGVGGKAEYNWGVDGDVDRGDLEDMAAELEAARRHLRNAKRIADGMAHAAAQHHADLRAEQS